MFTLYFICSCYWISGCMSLSQSAQLSRFLKNLTDNDYDKRVRPTQSATNVSVQIGIVAMGPLNLRTMSLGSEILLRIWWRDPRLAIDNTTEFTLSNDPSDLIWIPDVYVFNAIKTNRHAAFKPNIRTVIGPNGHVYVSLRLSIEFSCEMDFKFFPMDTQICSMNLESYSYKMSEVFLQWTLDMTPVDFPRDVKLLGYEISIGKSKNGQLIYGPQQTFALLTAEFRIKRIFLYYLYHVYIPSMLVVILSWSTFWIPPAAIPARVTIVVTNFLTSMLVFNQSGSSMPPLSYHTALDIFMLFNSFLIFMAMLEFLVLLSRKKLMNEETDLDSSQLSAKVQINKVCVPGERSNSPDSNYPGILKKALKAGVYYHHHPDVIDRFSRALFPLCYILFGSIYFMYYLIFN